MILKQNNQNTYLQAGHINSAYQNFMMILTKDITFLKLSNLLSFMNKTA